MKKKYLPGEMFQRACFQQNPAQWVSWEDLGVVNKKVWAERERNFFSMLSQQSSEDEQTNDSTGIPTLQEGP